jgi:hypothetical protein
MAREGLVLESMFCAVLPGRGMGSAKMGKEAVA